MADDGLLLNFSVGEVAPSPKPIYKGGHWKERLHLKRSSQKRRPPESNRLEQRGETAAPPPPKKLKLATSRVVRPQNPASSGDLRSNGLPREVISSLFTYNPSSRSTPKNPKDGDSAPANVAASNAPLVDGIDTFTSLGLSPSISTHLLSKMELKAPTAIQKSTVTQLVNDDSDAFIQAETGSGKTLAYLLPIVHRIIEASRGQASASSNGMSNLVGRDSGLFAIILAPTRELSKQILVVLESLLRCAHWIVAGTVIGGEKKKSEKARLRKGLNILVATPGRLVDHLSNTEVLDVSNVRWLVLDEGDRLMELGFENDIRTILSKLKEKSQKIESSLAFLPKRRTTILCSATMKTTVEKLGEMSLEDAIHIKADSSNYEKEADKTGIEKFLAPAQLKQSYIIVPPKQRLVTLAALLKRTFARRGSVTKAIVFFSCADSVDFHFSVLSREIASNGILSESQIPLPNRGKNDSPTISPAAAISSIDNSELTLYRMHGSLPQSTRTSTIASFSKNSHPSILICTDVASRGLDLPSVDLVIEYDPAFSAEDHLHRIGRTARAGRDGRAIIFLMPGPEEAYVEILRKSYRNDEATRMSSTDADEMLRKGFVSESALKPSKTSSSKSSKLSSESWEDLATEWQLGVERWVLENEKAGELARKAYISHVRAYATHTVSEREIFDIKDLHLGHLAKAFALRDRPGNMGRSKTNTKNSKGSKTDGRNKNSRPGDDINGDEHQSREGANKVEAMKKMRMAMKVHMGPANEFNIG